MKNSKKSSRTLRKAAIFSAIFAVSFGYVPGPAFAVEAPLTMGTASSYALLSYAQTTSATSSTVSGSAGSHIGVSAATAHTGTISGYDVEHVGAGPAVTALTSASNALAESRTYTALGAVNLGGLTKTAGAYSHGTLEINGVLTLDGQGLSDSVFIFRATSTLVTASGSSVNLINGAQACNVFWQIGSAATLGSSSSISGHVIAGTAISTGSGAVVAGQLIATTEGITLLNTTVTNNGCTTPPAPVTVAPSPTQTNTITSHITSGSADGGNTQVINGSFVGCPITNIAVDGKNLPKGSWTATNSTITFAMPAHAEGVAAITVYDGCAPILPSISYLYTPDVTPNTAVAYAAPATLHVVKLVNNSHEGTSTPGTFVLHITKDGVEVAGSPNNGISGVGRSYSLAPGKYILFEDVVAGYRGVWSGDITPGGTVTLAAGETLTVTRTNYDIGKTSVAAVVTETQTVVPVETTAPTETINGGELPNTASPAGNTIFLGSGLIILSLIGFGSRKILGKR